MREIRYGDGVLVYAEVEFVAPFEVYGRIIKVICHRKIFADEERS